MFIRVKDKQVNLQNVSTINIIKNDVKSMYRIVFNMNYHIELSTNKGKKLISDYVYWDAESLTELNDNLLDIKENDFFEDNFINQNKSNGYVNVNSISSVKYEDKNNRVIFNLNHPVTFIDKDRSSKTTSEFVYVNCSSNREYADYIKYLNTEL